ncbi:8-amino-7-oxononanoate synthase [Cochlodiniinecator piscidefendens]|uniref:8-amino-7-oxononanoate synthase n=1 Tax=Cochlodiniinecator piscidefendens TaxID=2715756 RepID=UPI001409A2CF|nr:8-amino-7-oxononanoate synthase [Cochlodiniinecator piscidefendens]
MKAKTRLKGILDALTTRHKLRQLSPQRGIDFASNDYLGLAESDLLKAAGQQALARGVPVGSGGSRLLRGNHAEHQALEAEAAAFFGAEAALFMGGGFQANQAIFATLPAADDLILYDEYIHASAHEGIRLGRAEARSFAHNDAAAAQQILGQWRASGGKGQVWIAVESVYSMEGDLAPLDDLAAIARINGAVLVVDEAHATGVFGPNGRGLAYGLDAEILTLHTCGKGLGIAGGLVCGAKVMIDFLINRARPFIFATAPSPLNAALVRSALAALQNQDNLTEQAQERMRRAHSEAHRLLGLSDLHSQIIPVIIGRDDQTMARAEALQARGFDVRGIRPPTVPRGTARLRISLTGSVTNPDITALFEAIAQYHSEAA